MMNKSTVYGVVFGAIILLLLGYVCWQMGFLKSAVERFTAADAATTGTPVEGTYGSQMYVIRTFETLMSRKPTVEELKKYSVLLENDKILAAIAKDNNISETDARIAPLREDEDSDDCPDPSKRASSKGEEGDSDGESGSESDDGEKERAKHYRGKNRNDNKHHTKQNYGGHQGGDEEDESGSSSDEEETPSAWPPRAARSTPPKTQEGAKKEPKPVQPAAPQQKCKPIATAHSKGIVCLERADLMARLKAISNEVDCFYDMLRLMK